MAILLIISMRKIVSLTIACLLVNIVFCQEAETYRFQQILSNNHIDVIADGIQYPAIVKEGNHGLTSRFKLNSDKQYRVRYQPDTGFIGLDTVIYTVYNEKSGQVVPSIHAYIFEVVDAIAQKDFYGLQQGSDLVELPVLENDVNLTVVEKILFSDNLDVQIDDEGKSILFRPQESGLYTLAYLACSDLGCSRGKVTIRVDSEDSFHGDTMYLTGYKNESIQFLVPTGFEPLLSFVQFGEITNLSDQRFVFQPEYGFTGTKLLKFALNPGVTQEEYFVSIDFRDPFQSNGWTKTDYIYTEINHPISFNVLNNDIGDEVVEEIDTELEGELISYGSGQFLFVPKKEFSGLTSFKYSICQDNRCDTSSVYVAVHNYEPEDVAFDFVIGKNQNLELAYNIPIDEFAFGLQQAADHGLVEFADQNRFVLYTPFWDYIGEDHFLIRYCVDDQCHDVRINVLVIDEDLPWCFQKCVYPGDVNHDGTVDAADAVVVGANLGLSGPSRIDSLPAAWYARPVEEWPGQFALGVKHLEPLDADGDGFVTEQDTSVISQFYGYNHQIEASGVPSKKEKLQIEVLNYLVDAGDLLEVEIGLEVWKGQYRILWVSVFQYIWKAPLPRIISSSLWILIPG